MRLLVVDDQKSVRLTTVKMIQAEGHEADAVDGGKIALLKLNEEQYDLLLLDMYLDGVDGLEILKQVGKQHPDLPVVVFTANATIERAVEAMKLGAMDYLEKPFTRDHLNRVLLQVARLKKMRSKVRNLEERAAIQEPPIIYSSNNREMSEMFEVAGRAAPSEASILILGSSGTGKSILARFIHESSNRQDNAFVTISCPSLSKELLESELFGHVKGAFTGAVKDTWGKVDAARGGTLFLDEIGELPAEIQPKLLRLLQEKQYERLGETKIRTADIRVIAATNKNPEDLVKEGSFREDLYYRLNVINLKMPALKDRPDDLEQLAENFLNHFSAQSGLRIRGFSKAARKCLRAHTWPGNIRELRNVIERAVILARSDEIEPADLPEVLRTDDSNGEVHVGDMVPIDLVERIHAQKVIEKTESLEQASQVLGIDSATLYRKRKKWASHEAEAEETT